jgi:hypothetical protein
MAEGLTTKGKKLKVGQRFQMETAEAITIDGNVVIPAGSPATGEITEVRNKGMWASLAASMAAFSMCARMVARSACQV